MANLVAHPSLLELFACDDTDFGTITFTNEGICPITISTIDVTGDVSFFFVDAPTPTFYLMPGESFVVNVVYMPDGFSGTRAISIWVGNGGGATEPVTVIGTSQPSFSADPFYLDYNIVCVGETETESFVFHNWGCAIDITDIVFEAHDDVFSYSGIALPKRLDRGESVTIDVHFSPISPVTVYQTNMNIVVNDGPAKEVVTLRGESSNGDFSVNPDPITFNHVCVNTTETQSVTIMADDCPVDILAIDLNGQDAVYFSLEAISFPIHLVPNQSFSFDVTFTPTSPGHFSSALSVSSSISTKQVVASGNSDVGALVYEPEELIFCLLPDLNPSSQLVSLSVSNPGNEVCPISILDINIEGTDAANFSYDSSSLPFDVGSSGIDVTVNFTPAVYQNHTANLVMTYTDGYQTLSAEIPLLATVAQVDQVDEGDIVTLQFAATGVTSVDVNNDDNMDIYVTTNHGGEALNSLFINDGDGEFTIATDVITGLDRTWGAAWGDYNNDGFIDVFLARKSGGFDFYNQLYQNINGSFELVDDPNLPWCNSSSNSASWADYDNDGDLDILTTSDGHGNYLYRNDGNNTFNLATGNPIVNSGQTYSHSGNWGDYDNDGDLDLFIANDLMRANYLYRNEGGGNFTQIFDSPITTDTNSSFNGNWVDYDNDLDLDLFVTSYSEFGEAVPNCLYKNEGDGVFSKIENNILVNSNDNSVNSMWSDMNNDGRVDLIVLGELEFSNNNIVYLNTGNGQFVSQVDNPIANSDVTWGGSFADYNNDGFQDVVLVDINSGDNNAFFENTLNGCAINWLKIKCEGSSSNASGIGAKVKIRTSIGGEIVWQMREITSPNGRGSQNSLIAHFGVGDAETIDEVIIKWPSGIVQTMVNVDVNQFITATEPAAASAMVDLGELTHQLPGTMSLRQNHPNPFNPSTMIQYALPAAGPVSLNIYDSVGRLVKALVNSSNHSAGYHTVTWDGSSDSGQFVTSGVYFYQLIAADGKMQTRRMILMK